MPLIFVNTETQGSLTLARSPGYTNGKLNFSLSSSITYIVSKNLTGSQGLTVGATITKDMNTGNVPAAIIGDYTFPGTVSPPTSSVQFWSDWAGDIFDGWGYFYLYNPATNAYFSPILTPINQADGVITNQLVTAFGRTFTITHGYVAQGIFKYTITAADSSEFIFGAFGDMGSDGNTQNTNLSSSYSLEGENFTLYYNRNTDGGATERFYTYIIPFEASKNKNFITYVKRNAGPGVNNGALEVYSFYTVNVTGGVNVYFSKTNDVKDWVINDLKLQRS
jgi:hypothetical protein